MGFINVISWDEIIHNGILIIVGWKLSLFIGILILSVGKGAFLLELSFL